MSPFMSPSPQPLQYQTPSIAAQQTNTVGLVGFILVMVGLLGFCLSPAFILGAAGTVLCIIGVFKRPRGLAIAGLVVGCVELLVVIVVIAFLGVIIVSGAKTASQTAKTQKGFANATAMEFSIDHYRSEHGQLPSTLAELSYTGDTTDGFGRPIRYVPNLATGTYKLLADGWDGKPNTADDFTLADTSIKPYSTMVIPSMPPARRPASVPAFPKESDDPK